MGNNVGRGKRQRAAILAGLVHVRVQPGRWREWLARVRWSGRAETWVHGR